MTTNQTPLREEFTELSKAEPARRRQRFPDPNQLNKIKLQKSPPAFSPRPPGSELFLGLFRLNPSLAATALLWQLQSSRASAMDEYVSDAIFPNKRTPEDVFRDFRGRRAGIVKALTTDVAKFYELCDPEKENLCLYGLPNETWEVTLPAEEVPPELPEPALGINFARDGMLQKDWLALVAVHSDAWLIAVAVYFGARFGFDKEASRCKPEAAAAWPATAATAPVRRHQDGAPVRAQRRQRWRDEARPCWFAIEFCPGSDLRQRQPGKHFPVLRARGKVLIQALVGALLQTREEWRRLYMMINNLPTVFEAVMEIWKKQSRNPNCNGNGKTKSGSKAPKKPSSNSKKQRLLKQEEQIIKEDGGDDKDQAYLCGTCGGSYSHNNEDFWIACDICEVWYHGDCVRITPAQADSINQYKCPTCSNKRIREGSPFPAASAAPGPLVPSILNQGLDVGK
ncbi:hypothetical protein U9M48_032674 [Paspalum notatum var. saurae]|uniref:PHD finger protein ALFIN-LIKE n=1 Tax=Paspalum notatum var. saurae TaxID=547442 RepID=A0AAQ3U9S5_PASNO